MSTQAIKKDAPESAKNHNHNSTYMMTMQIRNYNDPFYQRQLQRKIKRQKAARRKQLAKDIASWTFGMAAVAALWIVMTGMWG